MVLNWKVADHETLGRMNCKAGSPPVTHLVLTLQDRGAIQPRQHTETDPSSAIHQECSGKYEKWGRAVTPFKIWSGLSESNRHLNLGKVREVKSNALERRHLTNSRRASIGK